MKQCQKTKGEQDPVATGGRGQIQNNKTKGKELIVALINQWNELAVFGMDSLSLREYKSKLDLFLRDLL